MPLMGTRRRLSHKEGDGLSPVLALENPFNAVDGVSVRGQGQGWPTIVEMTRHGAERARAGLPRQLPLPEAVRQQQQRQQRQQQRKTVTEPLRYDNGDDGMFEFYPGTQEYEPEQAMLGEKSRGKRTGAVDDAGLGQGYGQLAAAEEEEEGSPPLPWASLGDSGGYYHDYDYYYD